MKIKVFTSREEFKKFFPNEEWHFWCTNLPASYRTEDGSGYFCPHGKYENGEYVSFTETYPLILEDTTPPLTRLKIYDNINEEKVLKRIAILQQEINELKEELKKYHKTP